MPTFLVLKNGAVTDTIRGANPSALRAAVTKAAADAAKGPGPTSAAFSSQGRTLGGAGNTLGGGARPGERVGAAWRMPSFAPGPGVLGTAARFVGLYVTSLFSLDAYVAAERSGFSVKGKAG